MSFDVFFQDGEADTYLCTDGMLANHIPGRNPWELLVKGAQEANGVIVPVALSDLPDGSFATRGAPRGN